LLCGLLICLFNVNLALSKQTQVSPFSFLSTTEPIIQILPLFCTLFLYVAVLMYQISYKTVHNTFSMTNTFWIFSSTEFISHQTACTSQVIRTQCPYLGWVLAAMTCEHVGYIAQRNQDCIFLWLGQNKSTSLYTHTHSN